jgi:hypothetical protein
LYLLVERSSAIGPTRPPLAWRDDRAFRVACAYISDQPDRNVSLDELAATAGIVTFRLDGIGSGACSLVKAELSR